MENSKKKIMTKLKKKAAISAQFFLLLPCWFYTLSLQDLDAFPQVWCGSRWHKTFVSAQHKNMRNPEDHQGPERNRAVRAGQQVHRVKFHHCFYCCKQVCRVNSSTSKNWFPCLQCVSVSPSACLFWVHWHCFKEDSLTLNAADTFS